MTRVIWNKSTKYAYIFCEWKTEESYFNQLSRILNIRWVTVKTIDLEWWTKIMNNPELIKKKIISTVKHNNPKLKWLVPKIFIVFDLDIFIDKVKLDNTLNILKDYKLIVSNETFEYWILSHFKKYNLWKWKYNYLIELKSFLPWLPNMPDLKTYKMTWRNNFEWMTSDNIKNAIKNINEINKLSKWNLKDRDPYSNVNEIIDFLLL